MADRTNITELFLLKGEEPPENPLLVLKPSTPDTTCNLGTITMGYYSMCLNRHKSGEMKYGRTRYDAKGGGLFFMKPGQTVANENIVTEGDGFCLIFQEEYLYGHPLHAEIRKYRYFEYDINEALHLSPQEEQTMIRISKDIEAEYNAQDDLSREIILGHIASLLRYSQRFYRRQFIDRVDHSGKVASRFHQQLSGYFETGLSATQGLPSVKYLAEQLHVSPHYLSDVLKQETGKTALELIHLFLISEAKNLLTGTDLSISEISYNLGFENHPYFSRLFKRIAGLTPNAFKNNLTNWKKDNEVSYGHRLYEQAMNG
ncbi:MAG TPA: helix-turn-helix transcriptional regulator [Chitinophaga sp.]|uniref:helix-turn-helix domain-containing protein n=1 Tax=Chitinophaga sp. TaxID=1869181 RepID=UPI002BC58073|nr:helix-turn-helix transcriptional regulator [Chitinophaga sp.]HVI46079.1 helix-turn-helix transcriptional regulator [Chitinophaga sp.]